MTAPYISLSHQNQRCQHLDRMLVLSLYALFQREKPFCYTGVFVSPKRQLRRTVSIGNQVPDHVWYLMTLDTMEKLTPQEKGEANFRQKR